MASSSDLVVVAARAATYVPLLDVLRDWSTLGLVGPALVVNLDAGRSDDIRVPAVSLTGGVVRGTVLQDELAARTRTDVVRVVMVSTLGREVSAPTSAAALDLVAQVSNALPTLTPVRIHAIGASVQGTDAPAEIAWLGWHNVVVAPEVSASPAAGVAPLVYDEADPVRVTHLAGMVCSLAGLWSDVPHGPLDGSPVSPGNTLVLGRSFSRHLAAGSAERAVVARLSDLSRRYPLPYLDGSATVLVDDEAAAAMAMANALAEKHAYVFPRGRREPRPTPRRDIRGMEALRMLFGFLWDALRNAPRRFVERAVHELSRRTAAYVGQTVFGAADSEFNVVVNGVRADGTPATWAEIDAAVEVVANRHAPSGSARQESHADLTELWKDLVIGGQTLLDAGQRGTGLPPVDVGASRGVIGTPSLVAPDPAVPYVLPAQVAALVKNPEVEACDVAGADRLLAELVQTAREQPHAAGQIGLAQASLQSYRDQQARSYVGRFGAKLADGIALVRGQVREYVDGLRRAEESVDVPAAVADQQRRLGNRLKLVLILWLLLAVAGVVAWRVNLVSLPVALAVVLVSVVGWLGTSLTVFVRGQRELFAFLHRRRQMADQLEILRENLADALVDLRRLTRGYRQYLDWSRAFGAFVKAPLGEPACADEDGLLLGTRLPRNHRFGVARADDAIIDDVASRLRRELFPIGWTTEAWDAFVADLPDGLGADSTRLREHPEYLYTDPSVTEGSLLTTWSRATAARTWQGSSTMQRRVVAAIAASQDLVSRLLARVESRDVTGAVVDHSYEDFVAGIDDAAQVGGFQRVIFTPTAQSRNVTVVERSVPESAGHGMSRTILLTQFSSGFESYELNLSGRVQASEMQQAWQQPVFPDEPVM